MWKSIAAVILTPLVWGLMSVPMNQVLMLIWPEVAEGATPLPYLVTALVLSFVYSLIAGGFAGWLAPVKWIGWGAGLALLAVGVSMQLAFWDALPVWYHAVFLVALLPLCQLGATVVMRRRGDAMT